MKAFVINLERVVERRRRVEEQFLLLGLEATFHPAIDARELTPDHDALIDRETKRRLGLWPQADGSIANWISQRQVMRDVVKNGSETIAVFENDAGFLVELPAVLDTLKAIEGRGWPHPEAEIYLLHSAMFAAQAIIHDMERDGRGEEIKRISRSISEVAPELSGKSA